MDPETRREREAQLDVAWKNWRARPADEEAILWYGRRLAYLGRHHEAVEVYSRGLELHPTSASLLRHRGHRFITLRQLSRAQLDLKAAARLMRGRPDEVEPDGLPNAAGVPRGTLKTSIYYHLGLAQYLDGDLVSSLRNWRECLAWSRNDDMWCAATHWLYMSLRRLGYDREAAQAIGDVREDMDILENFSYHELLLMYRNMRSPEALLEGDKKDGVQSATVAYGVGNWYLYNGEREQAALTLASILKGDSWAAFGHIAAESDILRLGFALFRK